MDVFDLRNNLIEDYAAYVGSFINILDHRIREEVDQELRDGLLWPEPLLQLNPSFEPGDRIDELVDSGFLHPACREIFRLKESDGASKPMRLHRHQSDAVLAASSGDSLLAPPHNVSRTPWPEELRHTAGAPRARLRRNSETALSILVYTLCFVMDNYLAQLPA